ncbi:MAG: ABC transporter permease [Planctomycetes bacterium]|nr:ABC transporter permease [Planctomycetota bacterium]
MMIGVAVGVGALTMVSAIGEGTVQDVMDKVSATFRANNIVIMAGGGSRHGAARGGGPTTTLTIADLESLEARVPNVAVSDPSLRIGNRMVTRQGTTREVSVTGYSERAERLTRGVSRGAYFSREDVRSSARVALIGEDAALGLFGSEEPLGKQVRIGNVPFEIVGVLERGGVGVHGTNTDDQIYVPVSTAMRRLANADHISSAKIEMSDATLAEDTAAAIERVLRERHGLTGAMENDFSIMTPVAVQEMVATSNRTFTVLLPLIAAIALVVGALIIASLMFVAVNERRSEIGLRKAVGARSPEILVQFVIEALVITLVAGLFGLLLGAAGSQVLLDMQGKPVALPWGAMLIGFGASVAVGLLAGVLPARRAARLEPVEALR